MSEENDDRPAPATSTGLPTHQRPASTLLPEGFPLTIDGRTFRLEMRAVISGTKADIAAIKLQELE